MARQTPADDEWRLVRLDHVGAIVTGSTPPTQDRSNYGRHRMFAGPADLGRTKYVARTAKMLSARGFARSRRVPAGSTLFVCIGSTIGKVGLAAAELATNQQINAIVPNDRVDPEYLYYAATTLSALVRERAGEQAVPLVNKSDFSAFEIPLPSLDEQRRIAAALQETDRLAAALEELIAKKLAIKEGVMQELLTGRRRLPGFTEPWTTHRLSDLLTYEQPGPYLVRTSKQLDAGRVPVLTAGKTFVLGFTNETHGVYRAHPVVIFDDFTTASKYVDFDFKAKSSAMKILKPREGVDLRFVHGRMQLIDFPLGDHKRYWISEYSKQEIQVPGEDEQAAVARVLVDADDEIEALRVRVAKARAVRQGMAQELLTGRTRLPVQEDVRGDVQGDVQGEDSA
ncbi:restriction endonuclease subunit S [Streptomyces sp. NPDC041068]|uniref:restriction endonuclease subunit S n=1 Tax=Streptomyces sp. NPDC041068 TaxID=3155130 RepID=UPI0033DDB16E